MVRSLRAPDLARDATEPRAFSRRPTLRGTFVPPAPPNLLVSPSQKTYPHNRESSVRAKREQSFSFSRHSVLGPVSCLPPLLRGCGMKVTVLAQAGHCSGHPSYFVVPSGVSYHHHHSYDHERRSGWIAKSSATANCETQNCLTPKDSPKNCQEARLKTEVMTPHSTPLPPQYPQRYLAVFRAGLGILIIGGKEIIFPLCSSESGEVVALPASCPQGFSIGHSRTFRLRAKLNANPAMRNGGG